MAEPDSQTLRILRDIRTAIKALDQKTDKRFDRVDKDMATRRSPADNLRQAMTGESILGHYATAEFDERLDSFEKRAKVLEGRR
jgi:hypothetical protein